MTALLWEKKKQGVGRGGRWGEGETQSLTAPPAAGAAKLQRSHRTEEGWRREGKWRMTLTLTDHCSMTV